MQIELRQISHQIEGRQVLHNISVVVHSGQCLVVKGRSGSGKSLLFSIMCGIFNADQGQVLADDQDIMAMSQARHLAFRQYLGAVFQVSALISNLTLQENLLLPLNLYYPAQDMAQKQHQVEVICHEFGLENYMMQRTDQLSTGLAALAGLARALIIEPKCLVWDAPMSQIDLKWSDHVNNRLRHLKNGGTTFILFTNRKRIIEHLADIQLDLSEVNHAS